MKMTENFDMIQKVYAGFSEKVSKAREVLGRPLTYAEKVLYSHHSWIRKKHHPISTMDTRTT